MKYDSIGPIVSEELIFENVDGRRMTNRRRTPESLVYY